MQQLCQPLATLHEPLLQQLEHLQAFLLTGSLRLLEMVL